jgi:hypothetical protein
MNLFTLLSPTSELFEKELKAPQRIKSTFSCNSSVIISSISALVLIFKISAQRQELKAFICSFVRVTAHPGRVQLKVRTTSPNSQFILFRSADMRLRRVPTAQFTIINDFLAK